MRSYTPRGLAALALLVFMVGCGHSYRSKIPHVVTAYEQGNYALAHQKAREAGGNDKNDRDFLIWTLEQGNLARAVGKFDESNKAFDTADALFEAFDKKAKLRLDREALSALASPAALAYEGYGYDRIMTNVYKAANYLESGRPDVARIEIRRIADSQEKTEQRYRDKIKQNENAKKDQKTDDARAQKDPKIRQMLADFPDVAGERIDDLTHKAMYSNPFAEYLQGLFYLHSTAPGDREVGRVALKNAAGMAPNCRNLRKDYEDAERYSSGSQLNPKTYIIFETGMAPERKEIRIDIPVFVGGRLYHVGMSLPRLSPSAKPFHPYLEVSSPAEGTQRTEMIVNIDKLVAREFKDEMPLIVTRAVIGAATKIGMQIAAQAATRNQEWYVQLIAMGSTIAYSAAMNEADLRTFRTLPKQVQIASVPTPINGQLTLRLGGMAIPINAKPGKFNVVWVRSPSAMSPPIIRAFLLN